MRARRTRLTSSSALTPMAVMPLAILPLAILPLAVVPPSLTAQTLEIDHVFVFAEYGAPEAQILVEAGLMVMPDTSRHIGQGTASISVPFGNAYFELLWVEDAEALDQVGLGMPERRATPAGSPFGIGLRRASAGPLPFPTEPYLEDWMGVSEPILMAEWSGHVADPLVFVVPEMMRWDRALTWMPRLRSFTRHELGLGELTGVRIVGPGLPTDSPVVRALGELGVVEFAGGGSHELHLIFDAGTRGAMLDLRPALPVVFHY